MPEPTRKADAVPMSAIEQGAAPEAATPKAGAK
jgi:hypothetical protein